MTLRSFSRSRMIMAVISVLVTLTACGSGTTNTAVTTKTSGSSRASSTTTPPAAPAPIAHAAPVPSAPECQLITQDEAATALGFNPGPEFAGLSDDPVAKPQCRYGTANGLREVSFIAIGLDKYGSAAAAKTEFTRQHEYLKGIFVNGALEDVRGIGDEAMMINDFKTEATIFFLKGSTLVRIILLKQGSPEPPKTASRQLAQAALNHLRSS